MNEPTVNDTDWPAPAEPAPYRHVDCRTDPTATEPVQAERVSPSGGWLLAVATATTGVIIALMLLLVLAASRSSAEYTDWLRGAGQLKLEASLGLLGLERFLAGHPGTRAGSLSQHLDQADRYAEAMLLGSKAELAGFPALRDQALRQELDTVRDRLIALRQIARERLSTAAGSQRSLEAEARGTHVFHQFLQQSAKFEGLLRDALRTEKTRFQQKAIALITLALLLTGAVTWLVFRFERQRTRDYLSVRRASREVREQNSALDYLAHFDALTRLPNRTLFFDRTGQVLAHAVRRNQWAVLMFLDLDGFKSINDSLGHPLGDALLEVTAERLRRIMREEDTIARLGGDEFTVLLPYQANRVEAIRSGSTVAEKILTAFREPVTLGANEIQVTGSIGISLYPQDGDSVDELLRTADTAMYHAKTSGRDDYQFYSEEMNTVIRHRVLMEAGLRQALERNELRLYYQPIVNLTTREVVGAEALLRWAHPEHGLLLPHRFLHIAEDTGVMGPIGEWILEQVCQRFFLWKAVCPSWQRISINLGAVQFRRPETTDAILGKVNSCRLGDGTLEVDISESALMTDVDHSRRIIETLRQIGVRIAIDDFGTGYSSIANLKRFDVDTLKIHQSFIADLDDQPTSHPVVTAMIEFAHNLDFETVAEGVETESQRGFLVRHGCERAQGLLFGPPMPADEFTEFLSPQSTQDNPSVDNTPSSVASR